MEEFHQAVASHNGARVSSMFIEDGSTWFNVLSDAAYARALAKNPAALKLRHSSFQEFAKFVGMFRSRSASRTRFGNSLTMLLIAALLQGFPRSPDQSSIHSVK
jgi:hypothetical protein